MAAFLLALALSGEAYARERIRLLRTFSPPGKGMRLDISDSLVLGDPTTRISVVLFFDFGCPHCRECCRKALELVRRYPRCVHFWLKHYPLERECNSTLGQTVHHTACRGAFAGQAAHALKLDAEALGAIFGYQEDQFGKLVLARIGQDLGVPAGEWAELLAAPKTKEIVDRDIAEGNALNLLVVPIAFLNGRQVDTARLPDKVGQLCR
jgi:predicted DsbA family dithiol-disulfide isomerase